MARQYVNISKDMYLWAVKRAGYKEDEFLLTHPKFAAYINGEKQPTVRQNQSSRSNPGCQAIDTVDKIHCI